MAGDWIKFEHATSDKPEVVKMAAALRIDQDAVIGKLLRIWVWADLNCIRGDGVGVTEAFIDRMVCKRGFAAAMRLVAWLAGEDGNLVFTNFTRHNGATAKARALDNRRKASLRKSSGNNPDTNRTTAGTESGQNHGPEKRREENREDPVARAPERWGLPDSLNTEPMRKTWEKWLVHWSESFGHNRPMPEQTAHAQLLKLSAIGETRAIAAIENAITRGGLREPAEPFPTEGKPNANHRTGNSRGFSQQGSYAGVTDKH